MTKNLIHCILVLVSVCSPLFQCNQDITISTEPVLDLLKDSNNSVNQTNSGSSNSDSSQSQSTTGSAPIGAVGSAPGGATGSTTFGATGSPPGNPLQY